MQRVLALCAALLVPAVSPAAGPKSDAAALYQKGVEHFRAERFEAAAAAFDQAFALDPSSVLLYNLARSKERAGDAASAVATYRRYLELYPAADDRQKVEEKIHTLEALAARARQAKVTVTGVPADSVWQIDGQTLKPDRGLVRLEPGDRRLAIAVPGQATWHYPLHLEAGETRTVAYGAVPAPRPEPGLSTRAIVGLSTLGGALVFGGVGTGLLVASRSDDDAAQQKFDAKVIAAQNFDVDRATALQGEIDDLNDSASRNHTLALVSFGLAAAAAGVGTWLLLTDEAAPTRVSLLPGPNGLTLGGTF